MSSTFKIPRDMLSRNGAKKAHDSLRQCGCLPDWKAYTEMACEAKMSEMTVKRLGLLISEQCYSHGDIEGLSLTSKDMIVPYPKIVNRCLLNKVKNAKDIKNEAFRLQLNSADY